MTDRKTIISRHDKYSTRNPVSRFLVHRFFQAVEALVTRTPFDRIIDIGCGEAILLAHLAHLLEGKHVFAADRDPVELETAVRQAPFARYLVTDVENLPFRDSRFDLVLCTEVLEHVKDVDLALSELARICARFCILSVPREPLWRLLNMARGAYVTSLGNTAGHVNHWSSKSFVAAIGHYFDVLEVRKTLPWTIVLSKKRGG